ncbi:MAG: Panacea domain-containing protein [Ktedonobacteraceae bacterium]
MISFHFEPQKFASAVGYIAERVPNVTKKQICKLLFFADKAHLLRFGRTITGDTYYALEQGPVPTKGLDAINSRGNQEFMEAVRTVGHLAGWEFRLDAPPDLKALSRSDIAVLDEVIKRFGQFPAWKLEKISHREQAWIKATQNGPMAFEDFFEGHSEEAIRVKEILLEESIA